MRCGCDIKLPRTKQISIYLSTQICTFLCRQLADIHSFIEDLDGEGEGWGESHLSLLVVLLQHGDGCLGVSRENKQSQNRPKCQNIISHASFLDSSLSDKPHSISRASHCAEQNNNTVGNWFVLPHQRQRGQTCLYSSYCQASWTKVIYTMLWRGSVTHNALHAALRKPTEIIRSHHESGLTQLALNRPQHVCLLGSSSLCHGHCVQGFSAALPPGVNIWSISFLHVWTHLVFLYKL